MLVSSYLLKMLKDWREDNFISGFASNQTQAFFYDMIASYIAD